MAAVFSQMARGMVSPGLVAITCKLALPECLADVLIKELTRLVETVQGPVNALSKSPSVSRLAPTSGIVPATSLRSSTYTSPAVPCMQMSRIGRGAVPETVTYCHCGADEGELLKTIDQLPTRQLS